MNEHNTVRRESRGNDAECWILLSCKWNGPENWSLRGRSKNKTSQMHPTHSQCLRETRENEDRPHCFWSIETQNQPSCKRNIKGQWEWVKQSVSPMRALLLWSLMIKGGEGSGVMIRWGFGEHKKHDLWHKGKLSVSAPGLALYLCSSMCALGGCPSVAVDGGTVLR